ncbi:MAG: EutN/CcmL family microcompartment protein [Candidatus Eisenbacteria bacterium]|nr:EutN/CcmL family microcompartment protein [Candidatus Eisenbacteria bacterium]
MLFARVIGTVVATEKVPAWKGHRMLLLEATDPAGQPAGGRPFAAIDLVSAAPGQRVFVVRGREAAVALANPENPADAAIVGLIDHVGGL